MKRSPIHIFLFCFLFILSSCSHFVDEYSDDQDDSFDLQNLNSDEYQSIDNRYDYAKEVKFVEYSIDDCQCRVLIPDNHTIKKIVHKNGSVSYVGLVDMGMYALTFKRINKDSENIELDSFFNKDLQRIEKVPNKVVIHSDFILNGFNMKEVTTFVNFNVNRTYSIQRVAVDNDMMYKIEFFGVLAGDVVYSSANKFLNSLQKQYQVEM